MKRTALKPMSDKRRARVHEREDVRQTCIERDGGCVARDLVPAVPCFGRLDPHEPQLGADKYNPDRVLTLCRNHHRFVHDNPHEGRELGLLVHRWEDWSYERDFKGWGS